MNALFGDTLFGQHVPHARPESSPLQLDIANDIQKISPGTRVIVTGGTGFIGGRLVEMLARQGARVCCLIRSSSSPARLKLLPVETRCVDLADAEMIQAAVRGADFVFHCAYDWDTPSQNTAGTANLIAACVHHNVKRLVHVSTYSVYDPPESGEVTEGSRHSARTSEYARTKLRLERQVLRAVQRDGLRASIVQPTIVYGPFSRAWTIDPAEMLVHGTVVLPGQGEGACDAVFVDDVVDAILLAAQHPRANGERFIISGPRPVTWSSFYEHLAHALGVKGPEYRPVQDIVQQSSIITDLRTALSDPKKLVRIAVRVPGVRRALEAGLRAMPGTISKEVRRRYFGTSVNARVPGQVFVPDPARLKLFTTATPASSLKARRLLGYHPRFELADGMEPTSRYLRGTFSSGAAAD